MRTGLAYTSARILLLIIAMGALYLAGARGILLLALAFVVSALASYVLLSRQRDAMSGALNRRLSKVGRRAADFRSRLEEGAAAEDHPEDHPEDHAGDREPEPVAAEAKDGR
jgi:hypothetical protein